MHTQANKNVETYADPLRVSRVWNEFFIKAYDGKLSKFATAQAHKLESGKLVMVMPFIKGLNC